MKINWPRIWRGLTAWRLRDPLAVTWRSERREIRRLVEAELKRKPRRKRGSKAGKA